MNVAATHLGSAVGRAAGRAAAGSVSAVRGEGGPTAPLRDRDLRPVVVRRLVEGGSTLVVGEVPLWSSYVRTDLLAIGDDRLTLVEIKSDVDSLHRLPAQADGYSRVADRAVLVTTARHLVRARDLVPPWWQVLVAGRSDNGSPTISEDQPGGPNPAVEAYALAQTLLRRELRDVLYWRGLPTLSRLGVNQVRQTVSDQVSLDELRAEVRTALTRRVWTPAQTLHRGPAHLKLVSDTGEPAAAGTIWKDPS